MPPHPLRSEEDFMPDSDRIIRMKAVLARTGLSRTTIYRKIREGTFPPQVPISVHGAGWYESAVNSWLADPPGWRPAVQPALDAKAV
jgi:prophage regulatory protein